MLAKVWLNPGVDCQLVARRQHIIATHSDEAIGGPIENKRLPNLASCKCCPAGIDTRVSISYVIKVPIPGPPADQASRRLKAALGDRVTREREDEEKPYPPPNNALLTSLVVFMVLSFLLP